jgi:protein unc-45
VDKNCRTRILGIAEPFLKDCAKGENTGIRALAGSVLAKLSSASIQTMNVQVDLLTIFKDAYNAKNETALLSSIEGLAFTSVSATEKDKLIKDPLFINSLLTLLKSPNQQYPLVYGCLSILVNLTTYKTALNEEQKRINEIRRLAKETDIQSVEELDKDTYVTSRCKLLLAAGLIPTMNVLANHSSPACISAISRILLSSATAPGHRSILAHQGAIKLILSQLSKSVDSDTEIILSHALAKVLISVNPSLIFSSRTPITAPLQPLTSLLSNESLPNDLPRFEALLALTNLASAEDIARTSIVEKSWPLIETLLLNDNPLLQRASTELLCNLVVCQRGAEKFIPGEKNPSAVSRLHLLLALADVEDVHTRRAAGGALAMVTDFEEVCMGLLEVERGVERVGRMVEDQDEECGFRGVVCVRNLVGNGGAEARRQMRQSGVAGKIELMKSKNERIKGLCKEVIGMLA